jgi:hypothetical protein
MNIAYLLLDVIKRVRRVDGEADEDDVRVGVRERSKSVVIFLACGIPQGELDVLAVYLDIGDIVLKHSGYVDLFSRRMSVFVPCCCQVDDHVPAL